MQSSAVAAATSADIIASNVVAELTERPRTYNLGELLLDVDPTVHVLYSQWKGRRCDHCFCLAEKLRRCSGCKYMFYCGRTCQQTDWNPCHRVECKAKLPLALADLSKCVDALGRPRWKSAQIQLAFRLLTRWRLDPNGGWPDRCLLQDAPNTSTIALAVANTVRPRVEYPQNTYPPSGLDVGITCGTPLASGAVIRTAAIWSRMVRNGYVVKMFGSAGGGAFHRAVILLERYTLRVSDCSLVVRSLLAEHLILGEAFYAHVVGLRHSCQPTVGFTFERTRLQLRSLSSNLRQTDLSLNYTDVVGAAQALCLPSDIRRPQLAMRGIHCTCRLCRSTNCPLEGKLGAVLNALTRSAVHLFKHVNTQRSALEYLLQHAHTICGPQHHPTLTLMRLRLLYFELIGNKFEEAKTELRLLQRSASITHSGEQFQRMEGSMNQLKEALDSGEQRHIHYAMEQMFDVKRFIPN